MPRGFISSRTLSECVPGSGQVAILRNCRPLSVPASRAACRSSTQAGPLTTNSRSNEPQNGANQNSNFVRERHGAHHERLKFLASKQVLGPSVVYRARQAKRADDILDGSGLLAYRFGQSDVQVWSHDLQHEAGNTAACAHVEHALPLGDDLGEFQRVDQVASDELFVVGVPRQVQLRVPVPQQPTVPINAGDLLLRQLDIVVEGRSQGVIRKRRYGFVGHGQGARWASGTRIPESARTILLPRAVSERRNYGRS